jgi:Cu/Ag efflux pump CusA
VFESTGVGEAQSTIKHRLSQVTFPLNYHAEILGGTPESPTSHLKFLSFVLAALVGILLLLQAAFSSWRLAAMFFLVLPITLAGGLVVAVASGQAHTLGADAGLLAVFVFAARGGMLQIAGIRRLHAQDGGRLPASIVTRAARDRLGPSLSAALVTAATMVPFVVMGDVPGNEITRSAAAVILGGLLTATLVNQVLVPAMCLSLGPPTPPAPAAAEELEPAGETPVPTASGSVT